MAKGRKFSLLYDPAEDRLAWDMEDSDGATTRIWITQRFCRQFVGAIIPRLPNPGPNVAPEHQSTVQSFQQAAAVSSLGQAPPVQMPAEPVAARVRAAHMTPKSAGIEVTFDLGEAGQRSIDLDPAAARQMLALMHALHVHAGWPVDFWPEWIAQPAAVPAATPALN
jgi:hypothetical protein